MAPPLDFLGRLLPLQSGFSLNAWAASGVEGRFRKGCELWADSGFGTPVVIHLFYVIKIWLYLRLFAFCMTFSNLELPGGLYGIDSNDEIPIEQYEEKRAAYFIDGFQRFVTFNLLFEGLGFGCGSGPLSAHFLPPFTAFWHWLAPGTIKLPWRWDLRDGRRAVVPQKWYLGNIGGHCRTLGDCLFNVIHFSFLVRALIAPRASAVGVLLPVVLTLAVLAFSDATLFLASRSEHYGTVTLCTLVAAATFNIAIALAASKTGSMDSSLQSYIDMMSSSEFLRTLGNADLLSGSGNASCPTGFHGEASRFALTSWRLIQVGIWEWAAVSKWGPFFNNVIQVMLSNSPIVALLPSVLQRSVRASLYKDLKQQDFRPSTTARVLANFGSASEVLFPLLLIWGGDVGALGLIIGLGFHIFILSNVAVGVPQEWNVFCMSATLFLFGSISDPLNSIMAIVVWLFPERLSTYFGVTLSSLHNRLPGLSWREVCSLPGTILLILAVTEFLVPLLGNISPRRVSFLLSRRYYAGNWAGSVWLVRKSAWSKLTGGVRAASAGPITDQLKAFYGEAEVETAVARLMGFRAMHLNSRMLPYAILAALRAIKSNTSDTSDKNVENEASLKEAEEVFKEYNYLDGEFIAAWALGYNFGDGYFHGPFMLSAVQEQCHFLPGECVLIHWDSISLFSDDLEWFARDAADVWGDKSAASTNRGKFKKTARENKRNSSYINDQDRDEYGRESTTGGIIAQGIESMKALCDRQPYESLVSSRKH